MAAYTLAGAVTSVLVGSSIALAGATALPDHVGLPGVFLAMALSLVVLARELDLVAVPLPQIRRQTEGMWAKAFGFRVAAILWGLDLGLIFTTWLNFAGAWVLALVAFLGGKPALGAELFAAYWSGRALSVWIAPLLMRSAIDTPRLLATLHQQRHLFRWIHVAGLVCLVVVFGYWILTGTTM